MIDPYKGISDDCRRQARERSYENLRLSIAKDIITLMVEHGLTHKDLARSLGLSCNRFKEMLWDKDLRLSDINRLLDLFSHEMVPIFRRRWPATQN